MMMAMWLTTTLMSSMMSLASYMSLLVPFAIHIPYNPCEHVVPCVSVRTYRISHGFTTGGCSGKQVCHVKRLKLPLTCLMLVSLPQCVVAPVSYPLAIATAAASAAPVIDWSGWLNWFWSEKVPTILHSC